MTQEHPITVPAGSITCWKTLYRKTYKGDISETEYIATQAARWGADLELDACCEWLCFYFAVSDARDLRTARRPKPPSLKEQALAELELLRGDANAHGLGFDAPAIRRALESLPD